MKTLSLLSFLFLAALVAQAEQHPSFQLNAAAKRKLVEKALALKVGDSFQTVTNALGIAGFDQPLLEQYGHEVIGRDLKFYAVIWPPGTADPSQNELVDVTLDKAGHVRSVYIRVTLN